jgi:hypothetical protein
MKSSSAMLALSALAFCLATPVCAQMAAPNYVQGNQVKAATGIFVIDTSGNPVGTAANPLGIYDANTATLAGAITAPLNAQTTHGVNIGGVEGVTTAGTPGSFPITVQGNAGGVPIPMSGSVVSTPIYTTPVAYASGTVFNAMAYGNVIFTCIAAPSAGTIAISPDNANDFITQTALLNNAQGISTTASITAAGVYTVSGHQYVKATLTGGTCFIAGGQ